MSKSEFETAFPRLARNNETATENCHNVGKLQREAWEYYGNFLETLSSALNKPTYSFQAHLLNDGKGVLFIRVYGYEETRYTDFSATPKENRNAHTA